MIEYIDREALKEAIDKMGDKYGTTVCNRATFKEVVNRQPAADVVAVTRCKDCRRWTPDGGYGLDLDGNKLLYGECSINNCTHREDYFCSFGKREGKE